VPVHWLIDPRSRRVVVTAEGRVTRAEFEEYLEVVTGAGANGYAKIFDGSLGENAITTEDMALFGARFRQLHAEPHGPLAIVLPAAKRAGLVPVLGALAAADRPPRLFTTLRAACLARRPGDGTVHRMNRESGSPDCRPPPACPSCRCLAAGMGAPSP
jgi:hypothetical protein